MLTNLLLTGVHKLNKHNCASKCRDVTRKAPADAASLKCETCNLYFLGVQCLQKHIANNTCAQIQRCRWCFLYIYNDRDHYCGQRDCPFCKKRVGLGHQCYVQKPAFKDCRVSSGNDDEVDYLESLYGRRRYKKSTPTTIVLL